MKNNRAYLLRTEITKSHLNNRICQHCGVKTSTVTPSFYYVFNISLSCNINIPSFIGNLWWDLLLGNHLKCVPWKSTRWIPFPSRIKAMTKGWKQRTIKMGLPRLLFLWWLSVKRTVLNGSPKCRFKIFLNFSYEEQSTVSFISFWFYQAADWSHRLAVGDVSK